VQVSIARSFGQNVERRKHLFEDVAESCLGAVCELLPTVAPQTGTVEQKVEAAGIEPAQDSNRCGRDQGLMQSAARSMPNAGL